MRVTKGKMPCYILIRQSLTLFAERKALRETQVRIPAIERYRQKHGNGAALPTHLRNMEKRLQKRERMRLEQGVVLEKRWREKELADLPSGSEYQPDSESETEIKAKRTTRSTSRRSQENG